jgi:hypothetical protein
MEVLTALGLAAPAGLNAPLVLLLAGLAARFTGLLDLTAEYDWLASTPVLAGLAAWLVVEEVLDKVPGVDSVNDALNSALRPAAGAVIALAASQGELPPEIGVPLGLVLAGVAHALKATGRPLVTVGTAGAGNAAVSVAEDVVAVVAVLVALLVPVLVVGVLVGLGVVLARAVAGRRRRQRARLGGAKGP